MIDGEAAIEPLMHALEEKRWEPWNRDLCVRYVKTLLGLRGPRAAEALRNVVLINFELNSDTIRDFVLPLAIALKDRFTAYGAFAKRFD